uniref:Uncharacterized protein n=1 Tax=Oryza punctata TaxID=4537 RepID=A0A0E0L9I9_ORYPU
MSDVLMLSMSPSSPGDSGDPRPKRSWPARVARRTGLKREVGDQLVGETGARHAGADDACGVAKAAATEAGALMARALLVMSCMARLDDDDMGAGGGVEEAWATSRWWPPCADEVNHLTVRESMHGVVGNLTPSISVPPPTAVSLPVPLSHGALP